jgi:uncharacterized protein YcfJ
MSNKSVLVGMIAGIGIATAGGVAAYQFLGHRAEVQDPVAVEEAVGSEQVAVAQAAQAPAKPQVAPAKPRTTTAPAAPAEECWDEEITVQNAPKDEHAIGGTAAGAVVGGAIAHNVGDSDVATAAGAAAGAFIGRKIQKQIQENRADTRTETRVERRCAPAGTPH